ncbi:MAG: hypothetical protein WCR27_06755 [Eubacteriales bacterium]
MNMNIDQSKKFLEEAQKNIPGGVNSPARAFKFVSDAHTEQNIKDTLACAARYFGV